MKTVVNLDTLLDLQVAVRDVFVHDKIREYILDIVIATRQSNMLLMGCSPRGSLYLMRAAQANAAMDGIDYVRPDDVKAVAAAILSHRVMARAELKTQGSSTEGVIERILASVPAPVPVN